jgi:hypothetical protein
MVLQHKRLKPRLAPFARKMQKLLPILRRRKNKTCINFGPQDLIRQHLPVQEVWRMERTHQAHSVILLLYHCVFYDRVGLRISPHMANITALHTTRTDFRSLKNAAGLPRVCLVTRTSCLN